MKNLIKIFSTIVVISNNAIAQTPLKIEADVAFNNQKAKGEYLVYKDYGTTVELKNIRKPLIFVEGLDANQDYKIPDLLQVLYKPYSSIAGLQTSLGDEINALGYDIIILNFNNGADFIQRNALLLEKLITEVNSKKLNDEQIVIVGYSMGGVVARYALAEMEKNNQEHNTKLFVSFDAPQKGAHVPFSVQALTLLFNGSAILPLLPDIQLQLNTLNSEASKQLLRYKLSSATQTSGNQPLNSDFIKFFDEMLALNQCNGFPIKCRNIGISLGSWSAQSQKYNQNGGNGDQHSGFPVAQINGANIVNNGGETLPIWDLSTCEFSGMFTMFLSNAPSKSYPSFSDRMNYTSLQNFEATPTFFLFNSGIPLLPTSFSRTWGYDSDLKPYDFSPGSYLDLYCAFIDNINDQIDCSFRIADNATFIPTISALCYNTTNLFENISSNTDKLDYTPFDNIIALESNASHRPDLSFGLTTPTQHVTINNWLLDELTNDYGTSCLKQNKIFTGIEPQYTNYVFKGAKNIELNDYVVNGNSKISLTANNEIVFNKETIINSTDEFVAEIGTCNAKACDYKTKEKVYRNNSIDFEELKIIANNHLTKIHPNPASSYLKIDIYEKATYSIIEVFGHKISSGYLNVGANRLPLDFVSGMYFIGIVKNSSKVKETYKLIKL